MPPTSKPGALAILIGKGAPGKSPMGPKPDDSSGEDLTAAAQDLLDAIKAGDAKAVAEAFKAMDTLCESYEPDAGE